MPTNVPTVLDLKAGHHRWCPRCASVRPCECSDAIEFTLRKAGYVWLCACGRSAAMPYCDGHHSRPLGS